MHYKDAAKTPSGLTPVFPVEPLGAFLKIHFFFKENCVRVFSTLLKKRKRIRQRIDNILIDAAMQDAVRRAVPNERVSVIGGTVIEDRSPERWLPPYKRRALPCSVQIFMSKIAA